MVEVDQEAVAYDPLSKLVHYLNPMGSIVLQLCDGTSTVDETIAELAEAQEIEPTEIDESIRALVDNFVSVGLVEPGEAATKLREGERAGGQASEGAPRGAAQRVNGLTGPPRVGGGAVL